MNLNQKLLTLITLIIISLIIIQLKLIQINIINYKIISESNIIIQEKDIKEENKNIYQQQIETKNDYVIISPKTYKESSESSIYNSYIYKSS